MTDHLPHDDEEFRGLTRQQIQDRMERDDEWLKEAERLLMDFGYKYAYVGDDTMPRAKAALLDHLRARPAVEPAALDEDSPMPKHWSVTVEKDGESHLTLSHNHYCGEPDLDEALIVGAAKHLLSFVGYGLPRSTFDPDADEQQVEPAAPVAEQEPVAWLCEWDNWTQYHDAETPLPDKWDDEPPNRIAPLYTHPAEVLQDRQDAERLNWISSQDSDYFEFGVFRDGEQEGDFWILMGRNSFQGKTFREAIDRAIRGETGGSDE